MTVAFRSIQIGKETTNGTRVAATKKLIGTLQLTPSKGWHRPVDENNSLAEFRRAIAVSQMANIRYEGDITYQQLVDFLSMAVKGAIAPTTPGGGVNTRLWTFTPNLATKNVPDSFTFEYGDDSQEFESGFVICRDLELAVALNNTAMLRANMFAHYPVKSTFTGALSDPTVVEIVANHVKVWVDGTWAALGTTLKSNFLSGATVRLTTGFNPVKHADGLLDFTKISESKRHLEISMDIVMGAGAVTEYDAYEAGTDRAIRLKFTGPIIEGALAYEFTVNAIGKYLSEPTIFGEKDGEDIISLTFGSHKDSSGNEFSLAVQNNIAAL